MFNILFTTSKLNPNFHNLSTSSHSQYFELKGYLLIIYLGPRIDEYCKKYLDHRKASDERFPWAPKAKDLWPPDTVFIEPSHLNSPVERNNQKATLQQRCEPAIINSPSRSMSIEDHIAADEAEAVALQGELDEQFAREAEGFIALETGTSEAEEAASRAHQRSTRVSKTC